MVARRRLVTADVPSRELVAYRVTVYHLKFAELIIVVILDKPLKSLFYKFGVPRDSVI